LWLAALGLGVPEGGMVAELGLGVPIIHSRWFRFLGL
jgi:hypothetical protein